MWVVEVGVMVKVCWVELVFFGIVFSGFVGEV